ncbi:BTAD domain-containing putative transcriptional regulator [Actinomycetospora lemnae]|uniref:BTAD domain-containing putative transcriptional regulator n=1 Tax=Actinomycetospora lemnae TaxID=3019891 RepID=A0ABT5T0B1_9PSEU|nr:BTAD domain-containing putative transcriptional regulator [Actinomycetospora sp. DW7H6]MDD7968562.1 BTAD domain-containing putative transcriptional regulator [Actinomycetospora sp. DW7H6]
MLGPVEVVRGGTVVAVGGAKPRLLLGVLLAHRGRVVPLDRLADALWGSSPPSTALATVQTHVSRLRRVLDDTPGGPRVETCAPGYRLTAPDDAVDAARFEAGLARAQALLATDPRGARDEAEAALAEWRGPAFVEFSAEEAVRTEAARLDELRTVAQELAVDARLACGEHRGVVGMLEALVDEHALRERFWAQLMTALARSGRQAEALRRAQELRRMLRDELGLDPSPAIRALERDILTEREGLVHDAPATAPTAPVSPRHDELLGRDDQLALVRGLLADGRLVTITGPGGVGKTRLALELAATTGTADGVRVVELAPVHGSSSVTGAVAGALELQRRPERSLEDSIVDVLAGRSLLLVLDNCEHVLDGVAPLVGRVLRHCPTMRVLATSREPVGLPGEITWSLPPLPVPASSEVTLTELRDSSSVALFAVRACAARPGFVVDESNRREVAEICRRLDGVPLALELAAARVRSLTCADLADRLDERFRLLAGIRGRDPRHHALVDVVTWSYDLLTDAEQELFARLSVFAGAFDLPRVEDVCAGRVLDRGDVAVVLAGLVDKSMVVATESAGRMRYRLLETLRAFGRARLEEHGDTAVWRRAHAASYLRSARAAAEELHGAREVDGVRSFERDLEDLREAVRRSLALAADGTSTADLDTAMGLVAAVREFGIRTLRGEVFRWAAAASAVPGAPGRPLYAVVRAVVGYGSFVRGALAEAVEQAQEAEEAAGRLGVPTLGLAERVAGNALFYLGYPDAAVRAMDRMVAAAEATGVDGLIAHASYMSSVARTSTGGAGALGAAAAARRAAVRCGNPTALAMADYAEGLARERTDPDRAVALLQESAELAASVDHRWLHAFARTEELSVRAKRGELDAAVVGFRDVVDTWFRGGDWANQWLSLRHLFGVFVALGEDELAALLHGAIQAAGATTALPFEPADAADIQEMVDVLRDRLPGFDAVVARGGALPDAEVVRLTLERLDAGRRQDRAVLACTASRTYGASPGARSS